MMRSAARVILPSALLILVGLVACGRTGSTADSSHGEERPEPADQIAWTPEHQGWVTDLAGVLSDEQVDRLARMLAAYEDQTSNEFAVLTVEDLRGEGIESFSMRVARSWGVGKVDASNGLLIVLAKRERKIRIEVADGLVGLIPDELARAILERDMTPAFRAGRLADGIEAALQSLMDAASK